MKAFSSSQACMRWRSSPDRSFFELLLAAISSFTNSFYLFIRRTFPIVHHVADYLHPLFGLEHEDLQRGQFYGRVQNHYGRVHIYGAGS